MTSLSTYLLVIATQLGASAVAGLADFDAKSATKSTPSATHVDKPEWMDGGARQQETTQQLKRQIREQGHRRHGDRATGTLDARGLASAVSTDRLAAHSPETTEYLATPVSDLPANEGSSHRRNNNTAERIADASDLRTWGNANGAIDHTGERETAASGWPDACLFMFHLENLLPFLFPFCRPPLAKGDRSWILDIIMTPGPWERLLKQTRDAFETLRQSLQVLDGQRATGDHLCEAVRILAGIIQLQRFEISVSSFENYLVHHSADIALFQRVLDSANLIDAAGSWSSFNIVMRRLGTSSWTLTSQCIQVPSAEQAAFRFSAALVMFDDIIVSTSLQEKPILYDYHRSLLKGTDQSGPPIDLEAVSGCHNWVLLQISKIPALDAWKQGCKRAGTLDVMELVRRAAPIKDSLVTQLAGHDASLVSASNGASTILDGLFTAYYRGELREQSAGEISLVTRVWTHAAFIYLFVVVSGWQPASADVRYHVSRIIELLTHQMSPPALLRTMVWPFCVAGCLAELAQESCMREMVEVLKPANVFGTVRKALEIMENVWRSRETGVVATRDLAICFRSQGELVVLI
ncbi:uncharacterized protein Z519_06599 [Cladophialophora bantiana CBS 173.52]|uniref:Uncharacterized protein n=1 Tax=Cladophialophora bantiana (strain ATCC 10958 / CBS 173.52 / CDC B-1940 / NIH 8579) TaxID=1442370 RepID=A0A0D2ES71_CLAB1|nr:uncharacterized protein Z519_06599 [Cladophialophora bantiana CBS 173.52]KIW92751.1 hypothetical protein Z519_06599 [Cladophialophora bantiana CBS 173.52]